MNTLINLTMCLILSLAIPFNGTAQCVDQNSITFSFADIGAFEITQCKRNPMHKSTISGEVRLLNARVAGLDFYYDNKKGSFKAEIKYMYQGVRIYYFPSLGLVKYKYGTQDANPLGKYKWSWDKHTQTLYQF